jgi:undecaprenyl-diphosphatase
MPVFQALVLGLVQGLSEFLPISSSAHLTLTPWFFRWRDPGLSFDVALHLGTLIALLWYFRAEWAALARALASVARQRGARTAEEARSVFLIMATIPVAVAGFLFEDAAETRLRAPLLIASTLAVIGLALWLVDRFAAKDRSLDSMRWGDALLVGVAQALAIMPGVSRSGATITSARLLGFDRRSAAVFSFLLSMPAIAGAAILKAPDAFHEATDMTAVLVGVVAAAVSSWLAIDLLLRFVTRHSYGVFALYRVLLAGVVVLVAVLQT